MGSHIRMFILPVFVLSYSLAGAQVSTSDVRLAMREAEAISEAIASFYDDGGESLARLQQLVPEYLDSVPSSPWGTRFQYIQIAWHKWEIRLPLPSPVCKNVGLLKHGSQGWAQGWIQYPRCVLTDEELNTQAVADLKAVRNAIEAYRVAYGFYPSQMEDLVPVCLTYVPIRDPYSHPYQYFLSSEGYTLVSLGKDGAPGGQNWDADTIYSTDWHLTSGIGFGTDFEYVLHAMGGMRAVMTGLEAYAVDYGEYPPNLDLIVPTYIADRWALYDLFGTQFAYHLLGPSSYELVAPGRDGVEGTDDYEVRAANCEFTVVPSWDYLYLRTQKMGLFEGGLLRTLPPR